MTPEQREELARRLGGRIASLRGFFGLSKNELSRRTKINAPNIARLENGRGAHLPRLDTLIAIARGFGCPASLILSVVDRNPVE